MVNFPQRVMAVMIMGMVTDTWGMWTKKLFFHLLHLTI